MNFTQTSQPQFILMVGDEGAYFAPYNVPNAPSSFFARENDAGNIKSILARHPQIPLTLLADGLAQDFRRDILPPLNLFDRRKLLKRRLHQAFPQARLAKSLKLKSGENNVLFAGLQKDNPVFGWIEEPGFGGKRPVNICLAPLECMDIGAHLLPKSADGWNLVLSWQRTGGFRQIVAHKGELVFTRLTPSLPLRDVGEIAETIVHDVNASCSYLVRLGLKDSSKLHVALLMPEQMHGGLRNLNLPVHSVTLLSPYKAALYLELPFIPPADDPYSDLIYAGWLAQKARPRLPMAQQSWKSLAADQWGERLALAATVVALVMGGWQTGNLVFTAIDVHKESTRISETQRKLTEIRGDPAGVPAGKLKLAAERQQIFSTPVTMPWALLHTIDRGLGNNARLAKLDWQNDGGETPDETTHVNVRLTSNPDASAPRDVVVGEFQQIAQNLADAMPDHTVSVTRYPFLALPKDAVSNNAQAGDADTVTDMSADFVIKGNSP